MSIITIPPSEAHRLLPLLHQVHNLHRTNQPERYAPLPDDTSMASHLSEWLLRPDLSALGYQVGPDLVGYAIFEIERRAATPFRASETRAVLHHICVDKKCRRKGVGSALIGEIRSALLCAGGDVMTATVAEFNTASAALMSRAGLRPVMVMSEWRAKTTRT